MLNRQLKDFGLHPILGYVALMLAFVTVTEVLYVKTEYGAWLICVMAFSTVLRFSSKSRSEFLSLTFGDWMKKKIRWIENMIICLPFLISMLFHRAFEAAAITLLLASFMALVHFLKSREWVIPTPFSKKPYEFAVGFRNTWFLFPVILVLIGMAVKVDNANLSIFALVLLQLMIITYYLKPEDEFYIWIYSKTPRQFLQSKLMTATQFSFLLSAPFIALIGFLFPGSIHIALIFMAFGLVFLWTVILAKYTAHPREIHLPEMVILGLCLYLPILFLFSIPYFYTKAIQRLSILLK